MSNNHSNTGQDRKLISLEQGYEVRDWPRSLGCKEGQLRAAVKSVGLPPPRYGNPVQGSSVGTGRR